MSRSWSAPNRSGWAQERRPPADVQACAEPAGAALPVNSISLPDDACGPPTSTRWFEVLTATNRYALIHRTVTAVKPETRARRIAGFIELLARHETPHPQKRRPQ